MCETESFETKRNLNLNKPTQWLMVLIICEWDDLICLQLNAS